jgi:histidinol-phosphate aminotransferase
MIKERKHIRNLKAYSSARDEFFGEDQIFLDANENPYSSEFNRYPDPLQRNLKDLIAKQRGWDSEEILIGNGSDEILDLIIRAYLEPGKDSMVSIKPSYGMYGVLARINNISLEELPMGPNFEYPVNELAHSKAKLMFLCRPNNPSGNIIRLEDVKVILENFKGILVIDEAYIDFSEEESAAKLMDEYSNLIILQTLSKAFGMAGLRLGIIRASKAFIEVLNRIKPPYNVNTVSQNMAIKRLNLKSEIDKEIDEIIKQRTMLENRLTRFDFVQTVFPSQANFILIRVKNAIDLYQAAIDNGIVLRDRSSNFNCENCIRISIGTPDENQTLIKFFEKYETDTVYR